MKPHRTIIEEIERQADLLIHSLEVNNEEGDYYSWLFKDVGKISLNKRQINYLRKACSKLDSKEVESIIQLFRVTLQNEEKPKYNSTIEWLVFLMADVISVHQKSRPPSRIFSSRSARRVAPSDT